MNRLKLTLSGNTVIPGETYLADTPAAALPTPLANRLRSAGWYSRSQIFA
jgi:hypothetical protein